MESTTIRVTKDLRDKLKIGALYKKMTLERYVDWLVQQDLDLYYKQILSTEVHANINR